MAVPVIIMAEIRVYYTSAVYSSSPPVDIDVLLNDSAAYHVFIPAK